MKYPQYCLGEYEEGDLTCNGNSQSADEFDRRPCDWRNQCAGLRLHLKDRGIPTTDYIEARIIKNSRGKERQVAKPKVCSYAELYRVMDAAVEKYGIEDGVSTLEHIDEPDQPTTKTKKSRHGPGRPKKGEVRHKGPGRRALKKATQKAKQNMAENRMLLKQMFSHFKENLVEYLGDYKFNEPGAAPVPGRLYVADRINTSNYAGVYCCTAGGRDKAIALVKFKSRTLKMDVAAPVECVGYKGIKAEDVERLAPSPYKDGAFMSIMKDLDKEGAALAARVIAELSKQDIIKLPSAG